MLTLYQFPPVWNVASAGPFSVKLQAFMNLHGIAYETVNTFNPGRGPKGKLPYIVDENGAHADSTLIIEYLSQKHGVDMEGWMSAEQRAASRAFRALCDDSLYWKLSWSRWVDPAGVSIMKRDVFSRFSPWVRLLAEPMVFRRVRRYQHAQGTGRHSPEEIYAMAKRDLSALSDFLGEKPFFFGEQLSLLDITAFSYLTHLYDTPFENPAVAHAKTLGNLVSFNSRMKARCFPAIAA